MFMVLTAASLMAITPVHLPDAHHGFRLTEDMPAAAGTIEKPCPPGAGMTVCANRAKAQMRWRIALPEPAPETLVPAHHHALRTQHGRCANPVEEGLRCVRPTPVTRFSLGE